MNFALTLNKFFKAQWFSIFAVVIGFFTSLYFYLESKVEKEPAYVVTNNVGVFSSPQGLSSEYFAFIKRSDNSEVKNNVYLLEAFFWNKGKEPIVSSDILEPISISYSNDLEVIDVFISRSSRKKIVDPKIKNDKENKKLMLDFRVLEQDDVIGIQILYLANEPYDFSIEGTILGVKSILGKDDLVAQNLFNGGLKTLGAILTLLGIIVLMAVISKLATWFFEKINRKNEKIANVMAGLMLCAAFIVALIILGSAFIKGVKSGAEKSIIDSIPKSEKIN